MAGPGAKSLGVKSIPAPHEEAERLAYRDEDGFLFFPSIGFRQSLWHGVTERRLGRFAARTTVASAAVAAEERRRLLDPDTGEEFKSPGSWSRVRGYFRRDRRSRGGGVCSIRDRRGVDPAGSRRRVAQPDGPGERGGGFQASKDGAPRTLPRGTTRGRSRRPNPDRKREMNPHVEREDEVRQRFLSGLVLDRSLSPRRTESFHVRELAEALRPAQTCLR